MWEAALRHISLPLTRSRNRSAARMPEARPPKLLLIQVAEVHDLLFLPLPADAEAAVKELELQHRKAQLLLGQRARVLAPPSCPQVQCDLGMASRRSEQHRKRSGPADPSAWSVRLTTRGRAIR